MYYTVSQHTNYQPRAWRVPSDPGSIWFGDIGNFFSVSVSPTEAEALISALQRELAAMKAEAQSVEAQA